METQVSQATLFDRIERLSAENESLKARIAEFEKEKAYQDSPLFYFNLEDITKLGYDISYVSEEDLQTIAKYFMPTIPEGDEYTETLTDALDDLGIPKLA